MLIKFKKVLFAVLIGIIFLNGCCNKGKKVNTNKIVLSLDANPTTLDPAFCVDVDGGKVLAYIMNGLLRYDKNGKIIPSLAEKFKVLSKGKVYKFFLRKDVVFHNGKRFTAKDVLYSFKRILAPEPVSPRQWIFENVIGAEKYLKGLTDEVKGFICEDDYTFVVKLKKPFAPFLCFLTMPCAYIVPENYKDFTRTVIGTGPFKLVKYERDVAIELVRNEKYFQKKSKVDKLVIKIIKDPVTALVEFHNGNLDILKLNPVHLKSLKGNFRILTRPQLNVYYIGLNCEKEPFKYKEFRKALNLAVDKEAIIKTLLKGNGKVANCSVPPSLLKTDWEPYPYDIENARKLISKYNISNRTFNLWVKSSTEALDIGSRIASYLKKAGLNVKIVQVDWSTLKASINAGKTDMFFMAWFADYPDAENFLVPLFHSKNIGGAGNRARYKNKEIDRLLNKVVEITDEKKRMSMYKLIARKIFDDAPWIFLWYKVSQYAISNRVRGFMPPVIFNADKGTDYYIAED